MAAVIESVVTSDDGQFGISLMNLSDDVLLYILSYLKSNDLTCLSRTCSRMQRITSDKSLWNTIHYKTHASSAPYLFLHENMSNIGKHTREITIVGKTNRKKFPCRTKNYTASSASDSSSSEDDDFVDVKYNVDGSPFENKTTESMGENGESPVYPLEDFAKLLNVIKRNIDRKWLRLHLLNPLANICPNLHTLRLQYLRLFYYTPPILPSWDAMTVLSLRGSRLLSKTSGKHGPLYDLSVKLPNLVSLDIGCCSWVESHCLMAISKFKKLRTLLMDSCPNLGNCVAYISLAACLGFPVLEEIDLRDTQFGDSDLLSFKRNSTIKKLILGRQVKYVKEPVDSSESEEEQNHDENLESDSGTSPTGSVKPLGEHRQGGRKRKNPGKNHHSTSTRKRTRLVQVLRHPQALVIHVDLGLGVPVEHVREAGEYDWLRNLDNVVCNMVTDEGIVSLGIDGLPALEHLVLAGCESAITDQSLLALKKRTGLRYLDVRRTRVSKKGCEIFMKSCPDAHLDCDYIDKIEPSSSH